MIRLKKEPILLLFIAILLAILVQPADATAMSFAVPKGEERTISINLVHEDRVLVKFTVVGTLDFYITDPNGDIQVEYSRVPSTSYSFVCDETGEYILCFSNTDSSEDKLVTLIMRFNTTFSEFRRIFS